VRSGRLREFGTDACRIVHGDALEVLDDVVADGSADLVFADPPYNLGKRFGTAADSWPDEASYLSWTRCWLDLCVRKLAPTGSMYVMASTQAMPHVDLHLRALVTILSRIVWHYDSSGTQARQRFGSLYEPILHAVADRARYTFNADAVLVEARTGARRRLVDRRGPAPRPYAETKVPGNVWQFPRVRYRMKEYEEHPSQKPEALLERVVLASSNAGDLVLDPFSGTFTTGAVAVRHGRRFVGVEREEQYVEVGRRRLGLAGADGTAPAADAARPAQEDVADISRAAERRPAR
jgi:adenine-specific DNA-methyltransferase